MKLQKAPAIKRLLALDFDLILILTLMFGLYLLTGIHIHLHLFVFIPLLFALVLLRDSVFGQSPGKRLFGIAIGEEDKLEGRPSSLKSALHHLTCGRVTNTAVYEVKQVNIKLVVSCFLLLLALFVLVLLHFPLARFLANEFCCSNNNVVTGFR